MQELDFAFGNLTSRVEAFTNVSINSFMLDHSQNEINLNITVPSGMRGFADFSLQQDFLKGPYNVTMDAQAVDSIEADLTNQSYVYVSFPEGFHAVKIVGTRIFGRYPEIEVSYNQTIYVDETASFDASQSSDYGRIVTYEWNFGDGTNATGPAVSHSYSKEGTYQVELNVTNNNNFSSSTTLMVTATNRPEYIPLFAKAIVVVTIGLLAALFISLIRRKVSQERNPKVHEPPLAFMDQKIGMRKRAFYGHYSNAPLIIASRTCAPPLPKTGSS
jgi:PKD repeat protein